MSLMSLAKNNKISDEMQKVAKIENVSVEYLQQKIAQGKIVIPKNKLHKIKNLKAIGIGLSTKINTNIGTSSEKVDINYELKKLKVAMECKTDAVMDLSTAGNLNLIRQKILEESTVPVGTVPIYQAVVETVKKKHSMIEMREKDIFRVIEQQAKDGVDFITVHCGITLYCLKYIKKRLTGIVSRGGFFLAEWMAYNNKENPLYEYYDELLDIAKEYDITLSLGDALRPGCLVDAHDKAQIQELIILGELAERAWDKNVQVIIEGPGHMPLDQIETTVLLQKKICHGAPFYVLGPIITDIAPGYDHITSAIGGAIAASYGVDFLCYVTCSEHLRLPTIDDVREAVIISRIAAHCADIVKGVKGAIEWDIEMAKKRKDLLWNEQIKLAIDPIKAKKMRDESKIKLKDYCTMCGKYCAMQKRKKK